MFNIFQRKPKLVFKTGIPGLEALHPIVPAADFAHEFHSRAKHQKREPGDTNATTKCLGIRDYFSKGFVQTTFCDVEIITNGNGMDFVYRTPMKTDHIVHTGPRKYLDWISQLQSIL